MCVQKRSSLINSEHIVNHSAHRSQLSHRYSSSTVYCTVWLPNVTLFFKKLLQAKAVADVNVCYVWILTTASLKCFGGNGCIKYSSHPRLLHDGTCGVMSGDSLQ